MANRTERIIPQEFADFYSISRGTLDAVAHDLATDSSAVAEIMGRLTLANPTMAIGILALAREANDSTRNSEEAFIQGALTVLGALVKQEKIQALDAMLASSYDTKSTAPTGYELSLTISPSAE